jgi:large subunit ribosomal protein L13
MIEHHSWTTHSTKASELAPEWFIVDAEGMTLGRLATRISRVLQGKHKASYTAHVDAGDFVVVVNAEKVVLTGRKLDQKKYHAYSGYKGGLRSVTARRQLETHPERVLTAAVQGMVPGTRLGRVMLGKLKVYAGPTHPHVAQQPRPFPDHL